MPHRAIRMKIIFKIIQTRIIFWMLLVRVYATGLTLQRNIVFFHVFSLINLFYGKTLGYFPTKHSFLSFFDFFVEKNTIHEYFLTTKTYVLNICL